MARGVHQGGKDAVALRQIAVASEPRSDEGVLERPDRPIVIADRVMPLLRLRQSPNAPGAGHGLRHEDPGHGTGMVLVDQLGPEAVSRVGRDRIHLPMVPVQRHGIVALLRHPELAVELLLQFGGPCQERRPLLCRPFGRRHRLIEPPPELEGTVEITLALVQRHGMVYAQHPITVAKRVSAVLPSMYSVIHRQAASRLGVICRYRARSPVQVRYSAASSRKSGVASTEP